MTRGHLNFTLTQALNMIQTTASGLDIVVQGSVWTCSGQMPSTLPAAHGFRVRCPKCRGHREAMLCCSGFRPNCDLHLKAASHIYLQPQNMQQALQIVVMKDPAYTTTLPNGHVSLRSHNLSYTHAKLASLLILQFGLYRGLSQMLTTAARRLCLCSSSMADQLTAARSSEPLKQPMLLFFQRQPSPGSSWWGLCLL